MFVNLAMVLRDQGIRDEQMAADIGVSVQRFTSCKLRLSKGEEFTRAERIAVAALLGMSESWLFAAN